MTDIIVSTAAGHGGELIQSLAIGSGRFMRAVLVPFLSSSEKSKPAVFQTRGRSFVDSFANQPAIDAPPLSYAVDTIQYDGAIITSDVEIYGAGTLGSSEGRQSLLTLASSMKSIEIIGVGVTEAGLASADTQCMRDLTELLYTIYKCPSIECTNPNGRICVGKRPGSITIFSPRARIHLYAATVNTDNVPNNGYVIRAHMLLNVRHSYSGEDDVGGFEKFIEERVSFLNSMVDRITSARPESNGLVPLCEPLPAKALVLCDPGGDLPAWMSGSTDMQLRHGVKIRRSTNELDCDIALKLRVANGTHTAIAHAMALSSLTNTESLTGKSTTSKLLMKYLDDLFTSQILPGATCDGMSEEETNAAWKDWRQRLRHPHFGLSTFFITQNGAAKCGIRLGPTIASLISGDTDNDDNPLNVSMAFAVAVILRFLTPTKEIGSDLPNVGSRMKGVYVGKLDKTDLVSEDSDVVYADGLKFNLKQGWYEFRCDCSVSSTETLPDALAKCDASQLQDLIKSYLLNSQGGNLQASVGGIPSDAKEIKLLDEFACAISALYKRMINGEEVLTIVQEMASMQGPYGNGFNTPCNKLTTDE